MCVILTYWWARYTHSYLYTFAHRLGNLDSKRIFQCHHMRRCVHTWHLHICHVLRNKIYMHWMVNHFSPQIQAIKRQFRLVRPQRIPLWWLILHVNVWRSHGLRRYTLKMFCGLINFPLVELILKRLFNLHYNSSYTALYTIVYYTVLLQHQIHLLSLKDPFTIEVLIAIPV